MPTNIDTNSLSKPALITDLNDGFVGKEIYSHARNLTPYSHMGDEGTLSNEMSTKFCCSIPDTFIGNVDLNDDRHLVFSTDGIISKIGIADLNSCTYTPILSDGCPSFKIDKVMSGVSKKLFNNDIITTFGQKGEPTYRLNLSEIPYKYTTKTDECKTKVYTKAIDCNEMLLFKKITFPIIDIEASIGGTLPNGVYGVAFAYIINEQVFSDYYVSGQKIQIHELIQNASVSVSISNLDRDFDKYQLIVIGNVNGVKTAKVVGEYSTSQSNVIISDFNQAISVTLESLVLRKKTWQSAGLISSNSNYLLLGDLTTKPKVNYQPQAMKIEAEYVVIQVLEDYYTKTPKNIQYYGDENYDFSIEWIYDDGEITNSFHIPGRIKLASDSITPVGEDVYEWDADIKPDKLENWQVNNTAEPPIPTGLPFINNTRIAYTGKLGYFESTELYPDNKELFPLDACTPIRYHKFPDETLVPRYEIINGIKYLNLKSVRFKNITPPLDDKGNKIPNIIGYRHLRSERKGGNKTVISTGIFSNVRKYKDSQNQNREIMYANYPYNDLSEDSFISSTQTAYKNNSEQNFTPLSSFYKNKFNYYSPHSLYNLKYKHGSEFKIYGEESGDVKGYFEPVYGHPKHKLITNFAFWTGAMIGVAEAYLEASGATSKSYTGGQDTTVGVTAGTTPISSTTDAPKTALASLGNTAGVLAKKVINAVKAGDVTSIADILKILGQVIIFLADAALVAVLFTMTAMRYAQNILDVIYNFLSFNQYAYQYNSHADFNTFKPFTSGNIRRIVKTQPEYLSSNLHTINNIVFNNFGKQESVYVELNKDIKTPFTKDNTRQTISQFKTQLNPLQEVATKASMYYGASRITNPNQYGQLGSSPKVLISENITYINTTDDSFASPVLFGGDCIIAKQSIITKHPFFRQNLAVENGNLLPTNFPDGIEYDYKLYRNIGYPRFWIDSTKYDYSSVLKKKITNFTTFSKTAQSKHNLDNKQKDGQGVFEIKDAYFYVYNNGVLDFYAECDANIAFREKTTIPFYSKRNTSLSEIHKSINLIQEEQFKLDKSYYDLSTNEIYSLQISDIFKRSKESTSYPNAVIYSLPSFNLQTFDNWQYFLPGNFFSFRDSDFGKLTGIHKLDQDRLIFLFSKSSPYISMGKDFLDLEASGRKITIGDGGLFAQDPRELQPTDNNYGACNSKWAFSINQFGYYYPSEKQSRLFNFTGKLDDISNNGMGFWTNNYMPIFLYNYFPNFKRDEENPIYNVGYQTVFDSSLEIIYFTKRDFIPLYPLDTTYDEVKNQFFYKGNLVSIKDKNYFKDISWTLSFDPTSKVFISFHDWHPDWTIQTDNHFFTVKDNAIWKHNDNVDSYCNFYGIDYPFEIEMVNTSGQNISIIKSIEYQLEAYKYSNQGRDKFHILNENFDRLIVSNTEQCSPSLNLIKHPQNPSERILYPKQNGNTFDILFTKEENKYRINQFWDGIKDRGEFTNKQIPFFIHDENGYTKTFNPLAIDISKPEKERKRFRHYFTKFWFTKHISNSTKYLLRLVNTKKNNSIR